jgi:hypothetical protein
MKLFWNNVASSWMKKDAVMQNDLASSRGASRGSKNPSLLCTSVSSPLFSLSESLPLAPSLFLWLLSYSSPLSLTVSPLPSLLPSTCLLIHTLSLQRASSAFQLVRIVLVVSGERWRKIKGGQVAVQSHFDAFLEDGLPSPETKTGQRVTLIPQPSDDPRDPLTNE